MPQRTRSALGVRAHFRAAELGFTATLEIHWMQRILGEEWKGVGYLWRISRRDG